MAKKPIKTSTKKKTIELTEILKNTNITYTGEVKHIPLQELIYKPRSLKIYRINDNIKLPSFATKQSACFDLSFQAEGKHVYEGINQYCAPFSRPLHYGNIRIMPGDRILVPTGLFFDIPEGYSVRFHPRSGLSYNNGIVLANLEGVIDSDYVNEIFVLLTNISETDFTINNGDRIAQAELVKSEVYTIEETKTKPTQKTDRVGGLGSTGIK